MNRELKQKMQQKTIFPKPIAPTAFITDKSTPEEVNDWLIVKEFHPETIQLLQGLNGSSMFMLTRDELQLYCGADDGHRLFSQLNIQKSTCGFKTTRTKEFAKILAQRRQRTGSDVNTREFRDDDIY